MNALNNIYRWWKQLLQSLHRNVIFSIQICLDNNYLSIFSSFLCNQQGICDFGLGL